MYVHVRVSCVQYVLYRFVCVCVCVCASVHHWHTMRAYVCACLCAYDFVLNGRPYGARREARAGSLASEKGGFDERS